MPGRVGNGNDVEEDKEDEKQLCVCAFGSVLASPKAVFKVRGPGCHVICDFTSPCTSLYIPEGCLFTRIRSSKSVTTIYAMFDERYFEDENEIYNCLIEIKQDKKKIENL